MLFCSAPGVNGTHAAGTAHEGSMSGEGRGASVGKIEKGETCGARGRLLFLPSGAGGIRRESTRARIAPRTLIGAVRCGGKSLVDGGRTRLSSHRVPPPPPPGHRVIERREDAGRAQGREAGSGPGSRWIHRPRLRCGRRPCVRGAAQGVRRRAAGSAAPMHGLLDGRASRFSSRTVSARELPGRDPGRGLQCIQQPQAHRSRLGVGLGVDAHAEVAAWLASG
jgi:hypothetical protein